MISLKPTIGSVIVASCKKTVCIDRISVYPNIVLSIICYYCTLINSASVLRTVVLEAGAFLFRKGLTVEWIISRSYKDEKTVVIFDSSSLKSDLLRPSFTIRCGCPNYFQISLENTIILGYAITAVRVIRW